MPTDIEQIQLIRSQTFAVIAEITAIPKPTYYIDGQSVSWTSYLAQLRETVDWCDRQLTDAGPYEILSSGRS